MSPEETPETLLSLKLSHFFTSLSLWSEETRLHEANLYVPSLPHSYNGEKLADLLEVRNLRNLRNVQVLRCSGGRVGGDSVKIFSIDWMILRTSTRHWLQACAGL